MTKRWAKQEDYEKTHARVYHVKVMKHTEEDVFLRLEAQPNKTGYIKRLIREDIARENAKK